MISDETQSPSQPRFSLTFWLVLACLALVGLALLFSPHSRPIVDKARRIDLETAQIRAALQAYESTLGAFPIGDSPAIFRALRGQNPRQIVFLQCRPESVSADGSMLDPWGTPYKVYFSGDGILIRSAGPNKQFDGSGQKQFDNYIR